MILFYVDSKELKIKVFPEYFQDGKQLESYLKINVDKEIYMRYFDGVQYQSEIGRWFKNVFYNYEDAKRSLTIKIHKHIKELLERVDNDNYMVIENETK
jgi:Fe2+ transport system protein B